MCEVLINRFQHLPFDSVLDILTYDDRFIIKSGNIKDYYRISKTDPRYEMMKNHLYYKYFYYYYARESDNSFLVKTTTANSNKYNITFCITNNFLYFAEEMVNDRTIGNLPDDYTDTTYDDKYKRLGDYIFDYIFYIYIIPRRTDGNNSRYNSLYYQRYLSYFMKRILYCHYDNSSYTIIQSC